MKVEALAIPDVKLVIPQKFGDARGVFSEPWQQDLHLQVPPSGQGKLVRVVRGAIWDVAVDVRHGSPSFGKWVAFAFGGGGNKAGRVVGWSAWDFGRPESIVATFREEAAPGWR